MTTIFILKLKSSFIKESIPLALKERMVKNALHQEKIKREEEK